MLAQQRLCGLLYELLVDTGADHNLGQWQMRQVSSEKRANLVVRDEHVTGRPILRFRIVSRTGWGERIRRKDEAPLLFVLEILIFERRNEEANRVRGLPC